MEPLQSVVVLVANSNGGWFATHDGVDAGGLRVAEEVIHAVATQPNLKKLSVIGSCLWLLACSLLIGLVSSGHSLGGLYARYAIGVLYEKKILPDKLEPVNFVTLASPHLGSRQHTKVFSKPVAAAGARLLGSTGFQLMLEDGGVPLLVRMATEDPFLAALRSFKMLKLYANVCGDFSVHFCSAAILSANPFKSGSLVQEQPQQDAVVLKRARLETDEGEHVEEGTEIKQALPEVGLIVSPAGREEGELKHDTLFSHEAPHMRERLVQMLTSLNELNWRKSFVFGRPFLAHTDIVVKRTWANAAGIPVVSDLIKGLSF